MAVSISTPKRRLESRRGHLSVATARRKDPIATKLEPETPIMVIVETTAAITDPITDPATGVAIVVVIQDIVTTIAAVAITVIIDGDNRGADSLIQVVYFRSIVLLTKCYAFVPVKTVLLL